MKNAYKNIFVSVSSWFKQSSCSISVNRIAFLQNIMYALSRNFFIAGSIGSITGLKDPCRVLKIIFSELRGGLSVLPDNTGYCHL